METKYILVVDDMAVSRLVLKSLFEKDYTILEAKNGLEALDIINQYGEQIAVVLLDLVMPDMDGFAVLKEMHASGIIKKVPVVITTAESDDENALESYSLGVSDMLIKPFNADIITHRVYNIIDLYAHKNHLEQKLQEQKEKLIKQDQRIKHANLFLIDALSTTVEFRDVESGEHVKRMRNLTRFFLNAMTDVYPLPQEEIEAIADASVLHDIGKIAIPDSVLLKPGKLTPEEFEIMKTHTTRGSEILNSLNSMPDQRYFEYCYEICRHHHERWDGKGYPDGLKGDEIPIWAQATSLADVYDALTSDRVYKKAYSHDKAVQMILDGECGSFNPVMLNSFQRIQAQLPGLAAQATK